MRADRVANLSPLKFYHKAPIPRLTFGLDQDEREMIKKGNKVSKHDICELLERKRFKELNKAAVQLQGELLVLRRCPKCTLVPPCSHYESPDHIINEAPKIMGSSSFKDVFTATKRSTLLAMVKSQHSNMYDQE